MHRINAFSFHGGIAVTPVAPGSQKWKVSESRLKGTGVNTPLHGRSIVYPGLTFAQPESFYRLRVCESQPLLVSHMSGQFVNLPLIFLWKLCNWGVDESGGCLMKLSES